MRLVEHYSHLNGLEHILVHKPGMWQEIREVVETVDANACRTKKSREARKHGRTLYSPIPINSCFKHELRSRGWAERRTDYFVTQDAELIRRTVNLAPAEQQAEIRAAGLNPIATYNQNRFRQGADSDRGPAREIHVRRIRPLREAHDVLYRPRDGRGHRNRSYEIARAADVIRGAVLRASLISLAGPGKEHPRGPGRAARRRSLRLPIRCGTR
jgi:hypothetical protein